MRKIKHGRLAGGCSDACCLKLEGLSVHIQGEDILEDVSFHLHCGEIAPSSAMCPSPPALTGGTR